MRGRLLFALKLAISMSLLVVLFVRLETGEIVQLFARADGWLLGLGALCLIGQTALATLKWSLLLQEQGLRARYLELLHINLISGFINLFTPGTVGGDAYRALRIRHQTSGLKGALPSIIVDRGSGVLALLVIGSLGLAAVYLPQAIAAVAVGVILCFGLGYGLLIGPIATWTGRANHGACFGALGVIDQVVQALRPSRRLLWVILLSFVFQLNTVWISWVYALATHIDVRLDQLLVLIPVVYLVEMLPISVSGVGLREGTLTVMFGQMGLVPEHGLVLGLTISIMRYVVGVLGGALFASDLLAAKRADTSQ